MEERSPLIEKIKKMALENGANQTAIIKVSEIDFRMEFRAICESKTCGLYEKSWMCPPNVGSIDELIDLAKGFQNCFVFQIIRQLEDAFDVEGMLEAGKKVNMIARTLKNSEIAKEIGEILVLGSGGCGYCDVCAISNAVSCPYPDMQLASVEAYGIDVMSLSRCGNLKYNNGPNTVTYFGVILYRENQIKGECHVC